MNAPFASARTEAITRSPRFSWTTPLTGFGSHVALSIGSTGHVGPARTVPLTRPDDVAADVDDDDGVVDVDRDVAEPQPARRITTAGRTAIERIPTLTFTPCAPVPSVRAASSVAHGAVRDWWNASYVLPRCNLRPCRWQRRAPVQTRRPPPDSAVETAVYRQHVSPRQVDHWVVPATPTTTTPLAHRDILVAAPRNSTPTTSSGDLVLFDAIRAFNGTRHPKRKPAAREGLTRCLLERMTRFELATLTLART